MPPRGFNRMKPRMTGSSKNTALGTKIYGGETGIRTLDRVSPIHAFQACAFNHSAISPEEIRSGQAKIQDITQVSGVRRRHRGPLGRS